MDDVPSEDGVQMGTETFTLTPDELFGVIERIIRTRDMPDLKDELVQSYLDIHEIETLFDNTLENLAELRTSWSLADQLHHKEVGDLLDRLMKYHHLVDKLLRRNADESGQAAQST